MTLALRSCACPIDSDTFINRASRYPITERLFRTRDPLWMSRLALEHKLFHNPISICAVINRALLGLKAEPYDLKVKMAGWFILEKLRLS
jgi:hypothetical protein